MSSLGYRNVSLNMEMNGKGRKLGAIKSFARVQVVKKWQSQLFNLRVSDIKDNVQNDHSTLCLPPRCSCNSTWHGVWHVRVQRLSAKAKNGAQPALHMGRAC